MVRVRENLREQQDRQTGYRIDIETKPNCWICEKEIKEGESFFGYWENGILHADSHRSCQEKENNKPKNQRKMCWMEQKKWTCEICHEQSEKIHEH